MSDKVIFGAVEFRSLDNKAGILLIVFPAISISKAKVMR